MEKENKGLIWNLAGFGVASSRFHIHLSSILLALLLTISTGFGYTALETPEGWASLNGGTTGGIGGEEVTVSTFEELKKEAESVGKKIIFVKKGKYTGVLNLQSDKSILGLEPGVLLDGNLLIDGVRNVIVRNIAVTTSEKCGSYGACQSGSDAVHIGDGAENVWLDHVDISDGQDGNCDVTRVADFITMTWCKFWYSYDKAHAFSNLIAGSNNETASEGKLNITFAYCWWADRVQERQPWGRFGKIHLVNNLYTSQRTAYACGTGHKMQQLIEYNVFNCSGDAVRDKGGEHICIGNIGSNPNITCGDNGIFTPPYSLTLKLDTSEVEAKVSASAGNTLTFGKTVSPQWKIPSPAQRPYLSYAGSIPILHNPASVKLSFTLVSTDGRTLLPYSGLETGKSIQLPSAAFPLYILFKDSELNAASPLKYFPGFR